MKQVVSISDNTDIIPPHLHGPVPQRKCLKLLKEEEKEIQSSDSEGVERNSQDTDKKSLLLGNG